MDFQPIGTSRNVSGLGRSNPDRQKARPTCTLILLGLTEASLLYAELAIPYLDLEMPKAAD
ncbi:hypothetical protein LguiB_020183 [Lonicera macranthoides]